MVQVLVVHCIRREVPQFFLVFFSAKLRSHFISFFVLPYTQFGSLRLSPQVDCAYISEVNVSSSANAQCVRT